MPSFEALPREILLYVARVLGSHYLRQSPENLLVCKAWYETVHIVAFEDVLLLAKTLPRFLSAAAPSHSFLTGSVRKLQLSIKIDHLPSSDQIEPYGQDFCHDLIAFAAYLPEMARLREFCLTVLIEGMIMLPLETRGQMLETVTFSLPKTLTKLTIDVPDILFGLRPSPRGPHVCFLLLNTDHLPWLRHLRIRLPTICPCLFKGLSSKPQIHLHTLVLNLSTDSAYRSVPRHAIHCTSEPTGFLSFYQDIIEASKAATKYLPSATTLRIIHHKLPTFQFVSHDILSDKIMTLLEGIAWTDVDWDDDVLADLDVPEPPELDLFENSGSDGGSSSASHEAPWIDLEVEAGQ